MRVLLRFVFLVLLLIFVASASAQDAASYTWEAGSLTLTYPAAWNAPLPGEQNGQPVLELAQVLVETPLEDRPPGIPVIQFALMTGAFPEDGNLLPFLSSALSALNIDAADTTEEATFLGEVVQQLTGTSGDRQLFGIARAAPVGINDVLVISGRAADTQRSDFMAIFDLVAESASIVDDDNGAGFAESEDSPVYGVLWQTQRTQADGADAFLNLIGLSYTPTNHLYTFERDLGVVQLDAATGAVLAVFPNEHITEPADLAAASDGTVYVADTACACVFILGADGVWRDLPAAEAEEAFEPQDNPGVITGFHEGAPEHLTVGPDGTLYATQITTTSTISVLVFANGERIREIRFDDSWFEQPLLAAAPTGQIYALTQFGELVDLADARQINVLGPLANQLNDLAVAPDGNLVIATQDQGVLILTAEGEFVSQPGVLVPNSPLPGEIVAPGGVAVDAAGRLYIADSDGTFGAITAMSTSVAPNRLGSMTLTPGLGVQGVINEQSPQQSWVYSGASGQRITITAVDNTGELDLALRLIDPNGAEAAYNDDHISQSIANFTDAQIDDLLLAADGQYLVVVERISGEGTYSLGLSLTGALSFDAGGVARAAGELGPAFPEALWEWNGSAGDVLTITMEAASGDLDPLLRIVGPDGSILAENDDADDSALGTNAQLVGVSLPVDGVYQLQAARFDGAGSYRLTIVSTS